MVTETPGGFASLALAPAVWKVIEEIGYEAPTPIQTRAIPPLLQGLDLLGQAQTGTGKTAAFALPLLSRLDPDLKQPQVLVLTPTRELAIQVAEAMQTYARHLPGFHVLPVYGGQGMDSQLRMLRRGVHVVVGTPGRIQDHLRRGSLRLDRLASLVIDEADEMLRMGFIDDVEQILEHTPAEKQVALFSATLPPAIRRVAGKYLREPVEVRIESRTTTVDTITQRYWPVSGTHKLDALTRMLEAEPFDGMLIFVRTKRETVELAEKLEARGFSCAPLNGDMTQVLREQTVDRLKSGRLDIVVATDVAARGLDVERISHVVNYDIPNDVESYVHRIGRTGRAGRQGQAILFVAPREQRMLRAIEAATRQRITPMALPSREDIAGHRTAQFKQTLSATIESQDLTLFAALIEDYRGEQAADLLDIAAALAYLVQKDRPLLPALDGTPSVEEAPAPGFPAIGPRSKPRPPGSRAGARVKSTPTPDRPLEPRQTIPATDDTRVPSPARPEVHADSRRPMDREPQSPAPEPLLTPEMVLYRLDMGRLHGALPKHIVGALANEAGIDGRYIQQLKLYDNHSTVELPAGMPRELLRHLRKVWVCNRQLNLSLLADRTPGEARSGYGRTTDRGAKRAGPPARAQQHKGPPKARKTRNG